MMIRRICPKCGGNDIVIVDGSAGAYGAGNNIMVGATIFSAVKVDRAICVSCGFTEEWISQEGLKKLGQSIKWHR